MNTRRVAKWEIVYTRGNKFMFYLYVIVLRLNGNQFAVLTYIQSVKDRREPWMPRARSENNATHTIRENKVTFRIRENM